MADVAVLGVGRMGAAMARRTCAAGHTVTLWNRTAGAAEALAVELSGAGEAAVSVAPSAAAAVAGRDVVLSVLAEAAATRAVLLDAAVLAALERRTVVCDLGTTGVAAAQELSAALEQRGVAFVDAPVSGSVPAVLGGTLLVMAAGPPEAVDRAGEVLSSFARSVVRVGDAGAGQAMKLAVNLVVHTLNSALSEALLLAQRSGIEPAAAYDVLADSVVGAPFVQYKRPAFLDPSEPVAMSLDLVAKDLDLVVDLAAGTGSPSTVVAAVREEVRTVRAAGHGAEDMAALWRHLAR